MRDLMKGRSRHWVLNTRWEMALSDRTRIRKGGGVRRWHRSDYSWKFQRQKIGMKGDWLTAPEVIQVHFSALCPVTQANTSVRPFFVFSVFLGDPSIHIWAYIWACIHTCKHTVSPVLCSGEMRITKWWLPPTTVENSSVSMLDPGWLITLVSFLATSCQ